MRHSVNNQPPATAVHQFKVTFLPGRISQPNMVSRTPADLGLPAMDHMDPTSILPLHHLDLDSHDLPSFS
jgi:hypothetical protein